MNYSEKLKSPKWQKKRLEVLSRDNFTCCKCGDTETELHVHHLKYTKEPYDAPNEDLETLCKDCHYYFTFIHNDLIKNYDLFKFDFISISKLNNVLISEFSSLIFVYLLEVNNLKPNIVFKKGSVVISKLFELSNNK